MALEDHRAVKAGAFDRLPVDDDRAIARLVEARQNVQHRGLAAAGVPNHAAELAARHRQPEIFEHRDRAAIGARIAFCNPLDGNEFVGHRSSSMYRARCDTQWCTADAGPTLPWVPVLHGGTEPVLGPRQARTRVRRNAPGTRE